MITLLLLFLPMVASILAFMMNGRSARMIALGSSVLNLAITVAALCMFEKDDTVQFLMDCPWMPTLGISFNIGMDGISILLVLLTNFLFPFILYSASRYPFGNLNSFYGLALLMQSGLVGVFVSQNAFLFYTFWELALIPIYFIAGLWGGENRIRITFKFFLYTLAGSLFMLIAIIYLYLQTPGSHSFMLNDFYALSLSPAAQSLVFWGFFIAFAIKMPVFPFHTWQPDTYTDAPAPATMLLSGIMLKMGIYGMIRWMLPIVPMGIVEWGGVAIVLAVIGVVYASMMALVQKDLKRLTAYSSIAHVGIIAAGALAWNVTGVQGAMIQMLSHGINVTALFFIIEIIHQQAGSRQLNDLGGIALKAPLFAALFMIILLGTVALPLTNGFVGEFMLLYAIFTKSWFLALFAGLSVILGAVYMLTAYKRAMFGDVVQSTASFRDVSFSEKLILIPLAALVIIMGVYPKPLLDISQPAVEKLIEITTMAR